jgi:hypothetical protein
MVKNKPNSSSVKLNVLDMIAAILMTGNAGQNETRVAYLRSVIKQSDKP